MQTSYDKFIEAVGEPVYSETVPEEIISQYTNIFTGNGTENILIECWRKSGFGVYQNGEFHLINPEEYKAIVRKFKGVSDKAIPFIRTALGNFLVWDLDEVNYLDVHNNEYTFRADTIERLFNYILRVKSSRDEELNGEVERIAAENFRELISDECVTFALPLVSGGEERLENMQKTQLKDALMHLIQLHQKPKKNQAKAASASSMDPNLKFTLLEALALEKITGFNRKKFLKEQGWTDFKIARHEDQPVEEIKDYFLEMDLSAFNPERLEKVWHTNNEFIYKIFPSWDGEDDYFEIKSLEGIEVCPNIRMLHIENLGTNDLTPLIALSKLENLHLELPEKTIDPAVLYQLPALKKLYLFCRVQHADDLKLLEADLVKKGIKVEIETVELNEDY